MSADEHDKVLLAMTKPLSGKVDRNLTLQCLKGILFIAFPIRYLYWRGLHERGEEVLGSNILLSLLQGYNASR